MRRPGILYDWCRGVGLEVRPMKKSDPDLIIRARCGGAEFTFPPLVSRQSS